MQNAKSANQLGITHQSIELLEDRAGRGWRYWDGSAFGRVEDATLSYFVEHGWRGYAWEGSLILNLIKAASFEEIAIRHRARFVESMYVGDGYFKEDLLEKDVLLNSIRGVTASRIEKNWSIMTDPSTYMITFTPLAHKFPGVNVEGKSEVMPKSGCMLDHFPHLKLEDLLGLFNVLGAERLFGIAEIFSTAPYTYRTGWPDLTLWNSGNVKFVEVKAPGDKMRESQRKVIRDILKPMNFEVMLVDVTPSAQVDSTGKP